MKQKDQDITIVENELVSLESIYWLQIIPRFFWFLHVEFWFCTL